MRLLVVAILSVVLTANARAQTAAVLGQVVLKETGDPLGLTTVSVVSQGIQLLTSESGKFLLRDLVTGEVRLRFKRIGFAPKDTVLTVPANDTAHIRIEMVRLAIKLPPMIVSAKCTDEWPQEPKPAVLAELFEQVQQNAERVLLLAKEKPFVVIMHRVRGYLTNDNLIAATAIDTVARRAVPPTRYAPKQVVREHKETGDWSMALPELPDFADTTFTNTHCFRYGGQMRWEGDSVIKVDFEPVPWLAKEVDIEGTMYLRVDNYQLVAILTKLNRIPKPLRIGGVQEVTLRAKFDEIVSGFPVLEKWDLTTRFRRPTLPRVDVGTMINLKWLDSASVKVDTVARRR